MTGLVLQVSLCVMVVASFYKIRRYCYQWFYRIHMFLLVIVFVMCILHDALSGSYITGFLFLIDLALRTYLKHSLRKLTATMRLSTVCPGLLRLSFNKGSFKYASG